MNRKCPLLVASIVILSACAHNVQKIPVATGGSRADAAIEMSYNVHSLENPVVDWAAAEQAATQRCKKWGYTRAEGFEGTRTQCNARNYYGCTDATVTRTYQCLN